jgi:hypothetical protein
VRDRIDPDDRVEAAVGDPRRAVWADDDAMWRGPLADRNPLDLSGVWIEVAEHAGALARVPNRSVWSWRHIVRMIALRHIEIADLGRNRRGRRQHKREDQSSEG